MKLKSNSIASEIIARGATSQQGTQFVQLKVHGRQSPWLNLADFRGSARRASDRLAEANIILLDADLKQAKEVVTSTTKFPPRPFANRVGWHGSMFFMPNGKIIGSIDEKKPVVQFRPDKSRVKAAGSLKGWLEGVAEPLADHRIASFLMMLPFAAALLRFSPLTHNFGFELAGPGGTGKSTIAKCVASVIGPIEGPGNYVQSMNITANALDQRMVDYHDLPLILEEWNLFLLGSAGGSATACADLIFRLSDGTMRMRMNGQKDERARFCWLVSSNEPLPDVLRGLQVDAAHAVLDRMMTIPISDARPLGVFDKRKGVETTVSELVGPLLQAASENHGVAFQRFVEAVSEKVNDDEAAFRAELKRLISKFERSTSNWDLRPTERVAQSFGLMCAAGILATKFGCLPRSFRPIVATKAACRMHLASRARVLTPLDRLKALYKEGRFFDSRQADADVTLEVMRDYDGVLAWGNDFQELQLTPGLSGFPCVGGHNGQEGVPLCPDAKNR